MRFRTHRCASLIGGVLLALAALAPPSGAQSTAAEDSVHFRRMITRLDSVNRFVKQGGSPLYAKRNLAAAYKEESLHVRPKVPPTPVPPPVPAPVLLTLSAGDSSLTVGQSVVASGVVRDASGVVLSVPIVWSSGAPAIASVSGTGIVTALAPGSTTVIARADSLTRSLAITVVDSARPPPPPPPPTPLPVDSTQPAPGSKVGPATVAELPRVVPDPPYPAIAREVKVCATCSLQAAINAAAPRDVLALAPGATYSGNFLLPNKGADTGWIVIRTDTSLTLAGTRMTPSAAAALRLAKIVTPNYTQAIGTAPSAHHWRLTGVEITAAPDVVEVNMLVRLGDSGTGQNTLALVPTDLVLDRVYLHGSSMMKTARCVSLNSGATTVRDSWLSECHHSDKDSQGAWGSNGPGPFLILNNHIEGGHQALFFGGADPAIPNLIPSDITVRGNHITRPLAWKSVWITKTIIETKNARRMLMEGNVVENVWPDAQAGYAFLLKSENQSCTAPWSQSRDITIRYNRVRGVASAFNIAANPGSCPGVNAALFLITDNIVEPFNTASGYRGDGIPVQMLGALSDVIIAHNTFATALNQALSFDGGVTQRTAIHSTVLPVGVYGIKGSGIGGGMTTLNYYAPGALFANNALLGGNVYPQSCTGYPVSNICPLVLPSPTPAGYDGRPMGADTLRVNAATAGVIVAP
jgi:hypothetical protein